MFDIALTLLGLGSVFLTFVRGPPSGVREASVFPD
jgi:hypothetical protein